MAAARAWILEQSMPSAATGCRGCRRRWVSASQSTSSSERTRAVAWAGAVRTGPTDGDRLARTNWWSPTFGMTRPLVSDSRIAVFDFQCVESYQQLQAEGYVLASAVMIET